MKVFFPPETVRTVLCVLWLALALAQIFMAVSAYCATTNPSSSYTFTTLEEKSNARHFKPGSVAVDVDGNVYFTDVDKQVICRLEPSGRISIIAGKPGARGSSDGTGSRARFDHPSAIATDTSGNIYVADTGNNTIRRIRSDGVVTTLAGLAGTAGSVDGTGSYARFNYPIGIAVDSLGNVYVADFLNSTIRNVTSNGTVTTRRAGRQVRRR